MSRKSRAIRPSDSPRQSKAKVRLESCVLEELWSIWRAYPRVPSLESRRLWAASRNANPHLVDGWFSRRRTCAKKTGQPLLDGSYDLSLDPPVPSRREPSATPVEPELEVIPDLSSDDTLAYPPDENNLKDLDASSDTVFDEDIDVKGVEANAYNQQLYFEYCQFQTNLSCANLDTAEDCADESFENPILVCNQGRGDTSDFTCILCSGVSDQDKILADSDATPGSIGDPFMSYPRLDFSSDILSELSAIPFLFCTPSTVFHDTTINYRSTNNWSMIEDELGRLMNDGSLDFSFLNDPSLTSMELFD